MLGKLHFEASVTNLMTTYLKLLMVVLNFE